MLWMFLEVWELRQSHKQLCSEYLEFVELLAFLDLNLCNMCLKLPRKVGHPGGTIYIYIY